MSVNASAGKFFFVAFRVWFYHLILFLVVLFFCIAINYSCVFACVNSSYINKFFMQLVVFTVQGALLLIDRRDDESMRRARAMADISV